MKAQSQKMVTRAFELEGVSPRSDPNMMQLITEGRYTYVSPQGVHYGWCGDFATYLAEFAGSANKGALNRVSLNGTWVPGSNLTMLSGWATRTNAKYKDGRVSRVGDYIIIPRSQGDHIALIVGREGDDVILMNGNGQMGAVSLSRRKTWDPAREYIMTDELFDGLSDIHGLYPGVQPVEEAQTWGFEKWECCP